MPQTFANLPPQIDDTISTILSEQPSESWISRANLLHQRYMERDQQHGYVHDSLDVLAYLALRTAATFAQISGTFTQVKEVLPSFQPTTLLDLGSGPGTGLWAAKAVWPSLKNAVAIDQNKHFISIGKEILSKSDIGLSVQWHQRNLIEEIEKSDLTYDVVLIANVLNELTETQMKKFVLSAYKYCKGIMVIIEPGTAVGVQVIEKIGRVIENQIPVLAPYINNSLVRDKDTWVHFPQRFIRPEFQRRIRQKLRNSPLMASDWEETKYAYLVVGQIPIGISSWGRAVGPTKISKGYVTIPILTSEKIVQNKVFKRNKTLYKYAKKIKWGELVSHLDSE